MAEPMDVTGSTFDQEVLQAGTPVLVDFWADWCVPCKMIAPMVDDLAREFDGKVKFTKVDVDADPEIAASYGIRSIPTLLIFKDGKPADQVVGAVPKSMLKKRLEAVLALTSA
ncbi:MAG: thioredoxin [Dehalococcoidia bacterium]|nr:thioredoxin [Dehalococcoidia bacterium]